MAKLAVIRDVDVWEDIPLVLMAKVFDAAGVGITQAVTSAIAMRVYDLYGPTPDTVVASDLAIVVADTVFDTLKTGSPWTEDEVGYNFKYTVAAVVFPESNKVYLVKFTITPTSGDELVLPWRVTTRNLPGQ